VLLSKRLAQPVTVVTQLGERAPVGLAGGTPSIFTRRWREKKGATYSTLLDELSHTFVPSGSTTCDRSPSWDDNEHRVTTVLLEGAVKAYASGREQASVRLARAEDFDVQAGGRHDERRPAVVLDLEIGFTLHLHAALARKEGGDVLHAARRIAPLRP